MFIRNQGRLSSALAAFLAIARPTPLKQAAAE
jgi:hypothetical protein